MESNLLKVDSCRDDSERSEIREELSKMSFEDLKKLKEKLGSKIYGEAIFGRKKQVEIQFKRKNKNRPREASSKIRPHISISVKPKEKMIVDPRFNRLCGTFNEKHFQNTYGFLNDIKKKEKKDLKKLQKKETDPNKLEKINYLLQRITNQEREKERKLKKQEKEEKEREEQVRALESGQKPHFKTKYEKKIENLVDKFTELKKSGKVKKYIEKKQKKQNAKERKQKRYFEHNLK